MINLLIIKGEALLLGIQLDMSKYETSEITDVGARNYRLSCK